MRRVASRPSKATGRTPFSYARASRQGALWWKTGVCAPCGPCGPARRTHAAPPRTAALQRGTRWPAWPVPFGPFDSEESAVDRMRERDHPLRADI
jgi:hypothetical protein